MKCAEMWFVSVPLTVILIQLELRAVASLHQFTAASVIRGIGMATLHSHANDCCCGCGPDK